MAAIRDKVDIIVHQEVWRAVGRQPLLARPTRLPGRVRIHTTWSKANSLNSSSLYVVSFLHAFDDLDQVRKARQLIADNKRFLLFAGNRPVESISSPVLSLNVRDSGRLHLANPPDSKDLLSYLRRFVEALAGSDSERSILDAWWEEGTLVVLSPLFERLRVPVDKLPKLGPCLRAGVGSVQDRRVRRLHLLAQPRCPHRVGAVPTGRRPAGKAARRAEKHRIQ